MDINYDLILSHLLKKKINTSKYTYNNDLKFKLFNNLKNYYRYGIISHDDNQNNISFYSSILSLIDNNFIITNDELSIINSFKNDLIFKYDKLLLSDSISDLNKSDIREKLKIEPNHEIIQYIVDILKINIIIFKSNNNIYDDNIYVIYSNGLIHDGCLDLSIKTLILLNYDNIWEPLIENNNNIIKKFFNNQDDIIIEILKNKNLINYYHNLKDIKYIEDYIINKTVLNKLKLDKIKEIIQKLNIDFKSIIKPNKLILINLILEKL